MDEVKKKYPNLKPAQKGEIRNPTGSQGNPISIILRDITHEYMREIIITCAAGNMRLLREMADDKNDMAEPLKVGVAKAMLGYIKTGNYPMFRGILDDVLGSVPKNHQHAIVHLNKFQKMTDEELDAEIARLSELEKKLE